MKSVNIEWLKNEEWDIEGLFRQLPEEIRTRSERTAKAAAFFFPYVRQSMLFEEEELCYSEEQVRQAVLYFEIGCVDAGREDWEHPIHGGLILNEFRQRGTYPGREEQIWRMAADAAVGHHERWDGTGYPYRQIATAIPMIARITAIADYFGQGLEPDLYADEGRFDPRLLKRFWEVYFEKKELRQILEDGK